jgi:hypothetical protein
VAPARRIRQEENGLNGLSTKVKSTRCGLILATAEVPAKPDERCASADRVSPDVRPGSEDSQQAHALVALITWTVAMTLVLKAF